MLSSRGQAVLKLGYAHGNRRRVEYGPDNPEGYVEFSNAFNFLMADKMSEYLNSKTAPLIPDNLSYGEGCTGTVRVRKAMASHMNDHFQPFQPVNEEDLTFTAGVTALNELCAYLFCDPAAPDRREAILLGMPIYGSFVVDMTTRTGVELVWAPFGDVDQFSVDAAACYERAILDANEKGVEVKALMICNPHNPLGECYSRDSLIALMGLCQKHNIHLISDEIYALSTYEPATTEHAQTFVSVLSIDARNIIDRNRIHVLYGFAKDFAAAGLRVGCLVSQNEELKHATRALCRFCPPSESSLVLAATILEDKDFVRDFIRESKRLLGEHRRLAEQMLDEAGIKYHKPGNAGFFIWIDLSPYLSALGADLDPWVAAKNLLDRMVHAGVRMSNGTAYHEEIPGRFRVVLSVKRDALVEGLKRIVKVVDNLRGHS